MENRGRFCIEVADAVIAALNGRADRVGIRFSPFGYFQGTETSDPVAHYGYVMEKLDSKGLAYVHLIEPRSDLTTSSEVKWNRLLQAAKARGITKEEDIKKELSLESFRPRLKKTLLLGNGNYDSGNHGLLNNGIIDAAV